MHEKSGPVGVKGFITELHGISRRIGTAGLVADARALKKMPEEIEGLTRELQATTARLDPIHYPDTIFDPTDPSTAGRVIALTLVTQEVSAVLISRILLRRRVHHLLQG
jgi:hypothetical protein